MNKYQKLENKLVDSVIDFNLKNFNELVDRRKMKLSTRRCMKRLVKLNNIDMYTLMKGEKENFRLGVIINNKNLKW